MRILGARANVYVLLTSMAMFGGCSSCKGKGSTIQGVDGVPAPNGIGPDAGVAAAYINFGNVQVGNSVQLPFSLGNQGASPLTIMSQTIVNDSTNSFSEQTQLKSSTAIAAGGSVPGVLKFTPSTGGPLTATLQVDTDGSPSVATYYLQGTGVDVSVSASPDPLAFGQVQVGTSQTQQLTFTNTGATAATVTVDPSNLAAGFNVVPYNGSSVGSAATLSPNGGTYVISVSFAPTAAQAYGTTLPWTAAVAGATVPETPVPISGQGVTGQLVFSPSPEVYSNVPTGQTITQTVTGTNTGANSLQISCLYLASLTNTSCLQASSIFSIGTPSPSGFPLILAAGASFTVPIAYTASGSATGDMDTLSADYTSGTSTTVVTGTDLLEGDTSVAPCQITISPASLTFGTVSSSTGAVTESATLTNKGVATCNVSGVALASSSDPEYALVTGQSTNFPIAASTSATIGVTFLLTNTGTPNVRKGAITFQSNDPNYANGSIPLTASLQTNSPYAGGWPKWHYDNNNSGKTTASTNNVTGKVKWTFTKPGNNEGESYINSPVVADIDSGVYVIYQTGMDGTLYAVDQGGNQLWSVATSDNSGDPHPATPAVSKNGDLWVVGGSDDQGNGNGNPNGGSGVTNLFYVSSAGTVLSSETYGSDGFDACPGLGPDGTFYETDDDGEVGAATSLDPFSIMTFTASSSGQVTIENGLPLPLTSESERFGVAIGDDSSSFWGNNGQFFGITPPGASNGFTFISAWPNGGVNVPSSTNNTFGFLSIISDLALDPVNTNFVFAYSAWETYNNNGSTSVVGVLEALSMANGAEQWTNNLPAVQLSNTAAGVASAYGNAAPAVDNAVGQVYVGHGDGLHAFNAATGAVLWTHASGVVVDSPAISGDGNVYWGDVNGNFYGVSQSNQLLFQMTLKSGTPVSGSPAIADDGLIYVTDDSGTLYCIE